MANINKINKPSYWSNKKSRKQPDKLLTSVINKQSFISNQFNISRPTLLAVQMRNKETSKKISKKYDTAYSKLSEVRLITIGLASPEKIRQWAEKTLPNGKVIGQVINANTLHHKTFKPQKGGLFCERIFGPLKDFQCACGTVVPNPQTSLVRDIKIQKEIEKSTSGEVLTKENSISVGIGTVVSNTSHLKNTGITSNTFVTLQGPKAQNERRFCKKCDVEYTWSVIRRYQLGYIQLISPVTHVWYLKGNPSYLSILLDMKKRHIEYVTYCTESLTLENALKGNGSRITNIPSKMLSEWEKTVLQPKSNNINEKNLRARKTEIKKQKRLNTKIQKRLSPLEMQTILNWDLESSTSLNNFNSTTNKKLLIILSLIHKTLHHCLWQLMVSHTYSKTQKISLVLKKNSVSTASFNQLKTAEPLKNFSLKTLMKKLPTSLYLFFTLQLLLQKQVLIATKKKLWKEIFLSSLKLSFKNFFFLYSCTFFRKQKLVVNDQKFHTTPFTLNSLDEIKFKKKTLKSAMLKTKAVYFGFSKKSAGWQNPLISKHKQILLFLESVKIEWFYSFLNFVKKIKSQDLLALNHRLITNYELTNEKTIDFISQKLVHMSYLKLLPLALKEKKNPKIEKLSFPSFFSLIPSLQKFSKTLLHAFFMILVKEKISYYSLKKQLKKNNKGKALNEQDLPQLLGLKKVSLPIEKLIATKLKNQHLTLATFNNNIDNIESRIEKAKGNTQTQKLLVTYINSINTRLNSFSGEYLCNSFRFLKNNNIGVESGKHRDLNKKYPKLVNNIYSLSHRERWIDEEWQNFIDYMAVPSNKNLIIPRTAGQVETFSNFVNPLNKELRTIPAYKNRIFNFRTEVFFARNDTLLNSNITKTNTASYSGPGIIQQLLNEFDFAELQKIDKQNRILLYQLNKHIFFLKKQVLNKSAKKELKECYKKRDQLIRRTKLIRTFFRKDSSPNSMVLTILPVLPPDLRPIVKIGGQIAASDLNRLYQRVIYRNDRLKKFLKDPSTSSSYEMKYAQRLLQESVDNLIQNGKSGSASEKDARGRALKSLSDLLKGKQGRFRQYLLGKRVDYSGRSVIVVGPKLKLHECGLPKEMALELYLPFLLKRILNHNYARTVVGAKTLMKKDPDLIWELLKEIMQTCPVLLNRAPTLHRLGIQAFQPKLIEGRAILLHPLVCPAFNADFDGDQMAVHVPITVEARAEAWKLMCARQNFLSPATGDPLAIPSQDMVLGCYYLTTYCNKATIKNQRGSGFSFADFSDVLNAYRRQIIDLHSLVWVKFNGHLEQGNDQDDPIEIRINSYGNWNEIYQFIQKNYSNKNNLVNQYVCTTPGRILFNFIVQNTLFFSKP